MVMSSRLEGAAGLEKATAETPARASGRTMRDCMLSFMVVAIISVFARLLLSEMEGRREGRIEEGGAEDCE